MDPNISNPILREAVLVFFECQEEYEFLPTLGGVNNFVHYLHIKDTKNDKIPYEIKKYILRVYNNGNNSMKVLFEHEILTKLNNQSLSFQVPVLLPNRIDGNTHFLLSTGARTCLADVIPGILPKLSCTYEIGLASGELSQALSRFHPADFSLPAPTPPYYDLYAAHPIVTRESFFSYFQDSIPFQFPELADIITFLTEEVKRLEQLLIELHSKQLPKQFIHGDLHYDNVLVDSITGKVTGILDFEFIAYDWRGMELAICLSKYASEDNALVLFQQFIEGFMKYGELTVIEMQVIPDLITLRILSNVVFFVGRAIAKEDHIETLTTRLKAYQKRIELLNTHRKEIVEMIMTAAHSESVSDSFNVN